MKYPKISKIISAVFRDHGFKHDGFNYPFDRHYVRNFPLVSEKRHSWVENFVYRSCGEYAKIYRWVGIDHLGPGLDRFAVHLVDMTRGGRASISYFMEVSVLAVMKGNFVAIPDDIRGAVNEIQEILWKRSRFDWQDDPHFLPIVHPAYGREPTVGSVEEYVAVCAGYAIRAFNTHDILIADHDSKKWSPAKEAEWRVELNTKIDPTWLKGNILQGRYQQKNRTLYLTDEVDVVLVRLTHSDSIRTITRHPRNAAGGQEHRPAILQPIKASQ